MLITASGVNNMIALARTLSAELLKIKRTLALWLAFILPAVIVFLFFLNYLQRGEFLIREDADRWIWMAQNVLILWSMLFLPLFIALEAALLSGLEHAEKNWKHLYALPVPRWAIYTAKLLAGLGILGLGQFAMWAWTILAGLGLRAFKPGLGFENSFPWLQILDWSLRVYLASWLILAIQTWVSIRWSSFVVSIGVGIAAVIGGLIMSNTELWRIYPWSLPATVANGFIIGDTQLVAVVIGVIGGVVVGVVGCWETTRRDVL
jgi:hypothetical protein